MANDLSNKIFKLLRQQKLTRKELAELTEQKQKDVSFILRALEAKGIPVQTEGKGADKTYYVADMRYQPSYHVISPASSTFIELNFGVMSDTHAGSYQFDGEGLEECMEKALQEDIDFFTHSGDLLDGYKVYRGQLNNLKVWKVEDQVEILAEVLDNSPIPIYGIGGNHDDSYTKQNGVRPSRLLSQQVQNYIDLGDYEADLVVEGLDVRLLHGAGGSAYARSYPSQKYLRNLADGGVSNLPDILLLGHYHTSMVFKSHGVNVIHPGNFQKPNDFMVRRGLTGGRGLYVVKLEAQYGEILSMETKFIKAGK